MKWNLTSRFIIPTVILIILGMGISNAIYYFKSKEALLNSISDQLIHQAEAIVSLMDEAIENILLNFVYWSSDATLSTVVQEYLGEMVKDSAHELLKKIKSDYGYYEKVMVADNKGVIISSSAENEIGEYIGDEAFFKVAMQGDSFVSDVYASDITSQPVFVVSGPLYMDNEVVGAICAVVAMSYFNENYIRTVKIGEKGYAFVYRRDGLIIAHPDPSTILSFNMYNSLPRSSLKEGKDGLAHYTFHGMEDMVALRTSEKMGWTVGVSAARDELLSPVNRLTYLNIGVLLIVFASVTSALFWLVRIVTRQLQEIVDLRIGKEGAEAASSSKSEFLANMSHEIRTPMNAVLGFADLLRSEIREPKQKQYLESIMISGKNLLTLINDILDLSKIEAGKLEIYPEPVDPHVLFNEVKKIFELEISRKKLEFIIVIAPDIPRGLMLDGVRLRQILVNLIGNAIKFTEKGWIRLSAQKLQMPRDKKHVNLQISIADTGIGISPESLEEIFEAFSQSFGQNPKTYGGTGLGLTITRNLVEIMGGSISVQSEVNKGTQFTIVFRNVAITSTPDRPEEREGVDVDNIVFHEAAVLVVDDNELNRDLIREVLRSVNLKVYEAQNGEEGVEYARQYRPDVILMDIKMPGMDGYEAARLVRKDRMTKNIPLIALTASAMKEDREMILRNKFDGYVVKPIERLFLFRVLSRFLSYSKIVETEDHCVHPMSTAPHESLSQEALERLPDLIEELDHLIENWRTVRRRQYIPDIKDFGDRIMAMGNRHGIGKLSEYGRNLLSHIESYDIEKIFATLEIYPDLIEALRRLTRENAHHERDGEREI